MSKEITHSVRPESYSPSQFVYRKGQATISPLTVD